MKLEQQVVNLELSKKLKKLGVKQESLWYWIKDGMLANWTLETQEHWEVIDGEWGMCRGLKKDKDVKYISAFTVAELGEMLPVDILCSKHQDGEGFFIRHRFEEVYFAEDTEANARAKMLIYLIENKLIKL